MRVLLLGGYGPLVKALTRGLQEEGCTVDVACGDRAGSSEISLLGYDAIILDLMRPEDVGLSLLVQGWRRAGLRTQVLALTAPESLDGRVPGLGSMADAWLTKPFALEELFARLRALVRGPS
jgi:DNA-binding response OmpR family regulator